MSEASERAAIVAWLRNTADENTTLAETQKHPVQRERTLGNAFMLNFLAKQIEDGDHYRTRQEVQERFRNALGLATARLSSPSIPGAN